MSMNCYRFEKRHYQDGFFNESIDATYIIHLEQNGRLQHINEQLNTYHPTNVVYILFNKGYKNCEKENIDQPAKDLTDSFITIFNDAKEKQYHNILVLEDDFFFSSKVKEITHINNINYFLNKHKTRDIQYLIGTIPWIRIPYLYDSNHSILLASTGMHSVVYTQSNRDKILAEPTYKLMNTDWDVYSSIHNHCYGYHIPLCYQLFPETENKKKWGIHNVFFRTISLIMVNIFDFVGLDKSAEPGYSYFYTFSLSFFYIILVILLFYIGRFMNIFYYKSRKNKSKTSSHRLISNRK